VSDEDHLANWHAEATASQDDFDESLPLGFPYDEHGLIEVEVCELWLLQDRHREAEARNGRLEATIRDLKDQIAGMRAELLFRISAEKHLRNPPRPLTTMGS
jgi:hypothetical protein